jgi:hypothetical protein
MANEMTGIYDDGDDLTAVTSAAVVGRRFVSVSADRNATTGNITVATTAAGARAHGVAKYDAASGAVVGVAMRGTSRVYQVTADNATIAAGVDVMVGASGTAKTWVSTNVAVGYAIAACAANGVAQVVMY